MAKKVAMVKFLRGSFDQEYSYKTDIEDLKDGDVLVVEANDSYSITIFQRYSETKSRVEQATKWVVQKVDIKAHEAKMFLGDSD
ncbi:hypothetical protein [Clostridium botulinum]|uniref:Uncharacterized protein n=2 Tax=Clostridium botulinum TaxID=1491 RepID=C1FS26_CLOBJ|nr:hypothetical protein [Clostridium botulinum]ACO87104.1 conserved hypothetical protein [Clostridium botulinum A2 str. Kyoto]AUN07539.1 hypothetical protein RSJ14_12895 [Clostridium botulinum]MBN3367850.1 hypothetical protein [Clostridium botulinum]MBN3368293.1 hypothetical protein [Clostridium botulinum]MBN3375230.1 hypothetical protein [Clostridium botulinum]